MNETRPSQTVICPATLAVKGMVYLCDGDICAGGTGHTHGSKRAEAIWTSDRYADQKGSSSAGSAP